MNAHTSFSLLCLSRPRRRRWASFTVLPFMGNSVDCALTMSSVSFLRVVGKARRSGSCLARLVGFVYAKRQHGRDFFQFRNRVRCILRVRCQCLVEEGEVTYDVRQADLVGTVVCGPVGRLNGRTPTYLCFYPGRLLQGCPSLLYLPDGSAPPCPIRQRVRTHSGSFPRMYEVHNRVSSACMTSASMRLFTHALSESSRRSCASLLLQDIMVAAEGPVPYAAWVRSFATRTGTPER